MGGIGALEEPAPAKVNLALHVTGRRGDGYHLLDSLVAFAGVADRLSFAPSRTLELEVGGPFADGLETDEGNLVLRAAHGLAAATGVSAGAAIRLEKNLPIASGIGGGSADAAAALRGLMRLWNAELDDDGLQALALRLGADVPVCLAARSCRMRGIGEQIVDVPHLPGFDAVLVNPMQAVSTAEVFSQLGIAPDSAAAAEMTPLPQNGETENWLDWLKDQRNDLEEPAVAMVPEIARCLAQLRACGGCRLARMSGSGATCFGLFADSGSAQAAGERISRHAPAWWVAATTLGGPGL